MLNNLIKYLKIILEPIKYSKRNFYIFLFMEIFDGFQSVFVVVLMSYVISSIESGNVDNLYFWTIIFTILTFIKLIFSIFGDSLYSSLSTDIYVGLTKKYFSQYIILDNTKVEGYGTGKMQNIIFKGTESIFGTLKLSIDIFVELIAIIYIFILILLKVPNLYYFVIFSCLFILIILLFGKGISKLVEIRKEAKKYYMEIDAKKMKILMTKFEIFQNDKIEHELEEIKKIYIKEKKLWWIGNLKKSLWQTGAEGILQGFYIILFIVIGIGVINGNYDIATFALFVWLLQILGKYAWQIRGYMRDIARNFIDVEKLVEIFETIPRYKDSSNLPDFVYKNGNINLKNIDFSYNEKSQVLKDFSLELGGGKRYAFVGESGGGKSTLIKLLAGYINSDSGEIIVDSQNIKEVNLKTFYQNIGYLSQEPSVFDGTILENLLYALNYIPDKKNIDEIIQLSKCDFINDYPKKLDTQIGERGIKLSGGQKQRLAIAKIMLKNPKIILLDEPTSALDSFNEEQINIALKNLFKNKTVIVIAHRLQTVKNSDMIFYIEKGKIIEKGNHNELLNLKGNYYKMIELQSGF